MSTPSVQSGQTVAILLRVAAAILPMEDPLVRAMTQRVLLGCVEICLFLSITSLRASWVMLSNPAQEALP